MEEPTHPAIGPDEILHWKSRPRTNDISVPAPRLTHFIGVPTVVGEGTDTGYTFIKVAGISIQGRNADKAWREARRLANEAGFPVKAESNGS